MDGMRTIAQRIGSMVFLVTYGLVQWATAIAQTPWGVHFVAARQARAENLDGPGTSRGSAPSRAMMRGFSAERFLGNHRAISVRDLVAWMEALPPVVTQVTIARVTVPVAPLAAYLRGVAEHAEVAHVGRVIRDDIDPPGARHLMLRGEGWMVSMQEHFAPREAPPMVWKGEAHIAVCTECAATIASEPTEARTVRVAIERGATRTVQRRNVPRDSKTVFWTCAKCCAVAGVCA